MVRLLLNAESRLPRADRFSASVLRGDIARLERCTAITTGGDLPPDLDDPEDTKTLEGLLPRTIKRSKPFKYT